MKQPTTHQKINYRMAQRVAGYFITKHPQLRKELPKYLKSKARYNTCYDLAAPLIPVDEVNKYINEKSDKVRTYLKNNLSRNNYLRVTVGRSPVGIQFTHGLVKTRPSDYKEMERTGVVRYVDVKDVRVR